MTWSTSTDIHRKFKEALAYVRIRVPMDPPTAAPLPHPAHRLQSPDLTT